MVIGIAFCMVIVYVCLLIRTFEPESVGGIYKSNTGCVFLGIITITYFSQIN
jgi:hypothetical protein